jgi:hypothetical protein
MTIETLKQGTAIHACQELAALVAQHTDNGGNGAHQTAISQLEFMRESSASTAICGVSEPILAIVIQGKKKHCWERKHISIVPLSILSSRWICR